MKKNMYYSLVKNEETKEADINIFGDITSFANFKEGSFFSEFGMETDVSAYRLSKQLEEMKDVDTINVHINSYGGEVAEGLAIYNALRNHKAKIKTYCDGFACSIASVIFMAGDERIMSKASLLMIHNAWIDGVQGNAQELRKQAEDLDKITSASINAYMEHVNITKQHLKNLMNKETWLTYEECLEMGFATAVDKSESNKASQSVTEKLIQMILQSQQAKEEDADDEEEIEEKDEEEKDPETSEDETEDDTDEESDDTEEKDEDDEDKATQKMVAFFNAIIGGYGND